MLADIAATDAPKNLRRLMLLGLIRLFVISFVSGQHFIVA
jgi:hypothetical protein